MQGWVAERFKAPVLKTGVGESLPWVRIPPHPPFTIEIVEEFSVSAAAPCFLP